MKTSIRTTYARDKIIYTRIGLICSPSNAYTIVLITRSESNTIDLGLVIGLS